MARPFEIAEDIGENTKVTSAYNFVDPPEKVGITPWVGEAGFDDAPSHVMPLPEGLCGELHVKWTFEQPFLVGGAEEQNQLTTQAFLRNAQGEHELILPGSSLRGMTRNTLEIITGARMIHVDKEARFSFRDAKRIKKYHKYNVGDKMPKRDDPDSGRLDFVQALFGHVPEDESTLVKNNHQTQAWKSRVFFGNAFLSQDDKSGSNLRKIPKRNIVTQSPRASFGEYYLRPKPQGSPKEMGWSEEDVQMAGYKRYPVSSKLRPFSTNQGQAGNNAGTNLEFLTGEGGSEDAPVAVAFTSTIKFHNLHPLELGALLWVLEWGSKPGEDAVNVHRHQLGRGKPQGYGRMRARVDYSASRIIKNEDGQPFANGSTDYAVTIKAFEQWLVQALGEDGDDADEADGKTPDLSALPHLAGLMAMANPEIGDAHHEALKYPMAEGSANPSIDGHKAVKSAAKRPLANNGPRYLWSYPTKR